MNEPSFGIWRSIAWPIYRNEVKKVLSMLLLMTCLCICYSILRNFKDTILLTAKNSGAEVIPFIKVWGILPGAIAMTWVYTKLRSHFSREHVFYLIVGGFIAYFLLFAFVIFPHSDQLNFYHLADSLQKTLPKGFSGLIGMLCNWTHTSFYVIAEMWSVLVLTVLFWGFANDITPLDQAKRSYGIMNIGSNIAPIIGGGLGILFVRHLQDSPATLSIIDWHQSIITLTLLISVFAGISMAIFYWINRTVVPLEPIQEDSFTACVQKSHKKRLSLRDCIRYVSRSKYLICLALIVLGFNIVINFTDILWKAQLKKHFVDPHAMFAHMNKVTIGIGCIATVCGLFFSVMVRKLGWTFVAMLTPTIMLITAVGFFSFLLFDNWLQGATLALFGVTPLVMTVYLGSIQNCLSKAGKYSVFDASKELAFLALDPESRLRGKAAIDGIGSGVGKSGASLTYQVLLLSLGSIALSTPYIGGILLIVLFAWIYSVFFLSKAFQEKEISPSSPVTSLPTEEEALKEQPATLK